LSIELSREVTEVAGVPGLLGWEKTLETSVNSELEERELPDSERGNLTRRKTSTAGSECTFKLGTLEEFQLSGRPVL
jgi:hypothetical protein